ncbi:MAG TPA: septum formation initiator [Bacteroidetes bacterium]|nr:septum formation initiator [Bacteroidota bacterium]
MAKRSAIKKLIIKIRKGDIPWFLKNRYMLCGSVFLIWMFFFDRNNAIEQFKLYRHLRDLKGKKEFYSQQLKEVKEEKTDLFTSEKSLEKYAREHYMMKKPNEDLFVIVPAEKK